MDTVEEQRNVISICLEFVVIVFVTSSKVGGFPGDVGFLAAFFLGQDRIPTGLFAAIAKRPLARSAGLPI